SDEQAARRRVLVHPVERRIKIVQDLAVENIDRPICDIEPKHHGSFVELVEAKVVSLEPRHDPVNPSFGGQKQCSWRLQQQRPSWSAADAEGSQSTSQTASPQVLQKRQHQPGAGGPDRVAECDGAAIYIKSGPVDFAQRRVPAELLARK